jgi:hypothetical protein
LLFSSKALLSGGEKVWTRVTPRSLATALLVFSLSLGINGVASTSAAPSQPHYHGSLRGFNVQGTIDLYVRDRNFNSLSISVHDVLLQCEDGTTRVTSLNGVQGDPRPSGRFLLQKHYYDSFGITVQYYLELAGRLKDRKAKGTFYFISSSPEDDAVTDCSTPNPVRWKASLVN